MTCLCFGSLMVISMNSCIQIKKKFFTKEKKNAEKIFDWECAGGSIY